MHRRIRPIILSFCILVTFLAYAQKRSITEKDLFQFNWIGDPQISPDGSRVAFVKVSVNDKKDGYDTSIWSVSIRGDEQPVRIGSGNHDSSPRWSPDGKWLAFIRTPDAPPPSAGAGSGSSSRPSGPQLHMLPTNGGESWKVTDLPRGVGGLVWSPDSKMIAFSSTTSPEDLARQKSRKDSPDQKGGEGREQASENKPEPEHESDVKVITHSVYRLNGGGYLDLKHPSHIWVMAAPRSSEEAVKPKQLTSGPFSERGILWAKDSSKIYFNTMRVHDPSYDLPHTDIYSVAASGGDLQKVVSINLGIREETLSPDGKRLAFCASVNEPVQSYTEPDLWVMDLAAGAQPRNLTTNYDFDVCSGLGGDQGTPRSGGGDEVLWTADGNSLVVITAKEGKSNLVQFDVASGKPTEITKGNQAVEHFRATNDGSKFVVLISTPMNIGDLFVVDRSGKQLAQITRINDKLFSQLNISAPEEIWYNSFDGKRIHAWIQKPPDFDSSKKYPLILDIHGGPHTAYGFIFDHEFQWMAAKGYVVLYPNPRGSTSYGQEFGNIIQYHYPGDDF
ncbi:MAG TPA: prolyl oligopeptidase family serine peptidase, partial [Candidatus Angelobacter sp.]|nr:prolyl oligopeptidase family serine peptidase [Candidatus Angelobacter sp.]